MSSFGFDLDPSSGVDAPLDRAELGGELVVVRIDVDFACLEQFSKRPEVLGARIDETLFVDRRLAVGVLQQRVKLDGSSRGWGTVRQAMDPEHAMHEFIKRAKESKRRAKALTKWLSACRKAPTTARRSCVAGPDRSRTGRTTKPRKQ